MGQTRDKVKRRQARRLNPCPGPDWQNEAMAARAWRRHFGKNRRSNRRKAWMANYGAIRRNERCESMKRKTGFIEDWDEALQAYFNSGDDAARAAFETRLRGAEYLVCLADSRSGELKSQVMEDADGTPFLPLYTSEAELRKASNGSFAAKPFQDVYDEIMADPSIEGAIINQGGSELALLRMEINRLMDEAASAGQAHLQAKEFNDETYVAGTWPPELERSLKDALGQFPGVREAYIQETHVAWRPDERQYLFLVDFDGDEADICSVLADAVKPHMGSGETLRFQKADAETLGKARAEADPAYVREDIREAVKEARRGTLLDADTPPYPAFVGWDEELPVYRANPHDKWTCAEFEAKLRAASYVLPIGADGMPYSATLPNDQTYLQAFTEIREMRKVVSVETRFVTKTFYEMRGMALNPIGDDRLDGAVINVLGRRLVMSLEMLARMTPKAGGVNFEVAPDAGGDSVISLHGGLAAPGRATGGAGQRPAHWNGFGDDWDEALREYLSGGGADARAAFEKRLRDACCLSNAAARAPSGEEPAYLQPEDVTPDGKPKPRPPIRHYLPVYTSERELAKSPHRNFGIMTFDEVYEAVYADKHLGGVAFNLSGAKLVLARYELNRIMDEAVHAGRPYSKGRETAKETRVANAWPPELERAFADALGRLPGIREAYIQETHVVWRPDERSYAFFIDFDGEEADVFPWVEAAIKPYITGKDTFSLSRQSADSLKGLRIMADPAYARVDVRALADRQRREYAEASRRKFFEHWDAELAVFRANPGKAGVRRAFDKKLCTSEYFVARSGLAAAISSRPAPQGVAQARRDGIPNAGSGELRPDGLDGIPLAVFTDLREMRKQYSINTEFIVVPFRTLYVMVMGGNRPLPGLDINPGGARLVIPPRELERVWRDFDLYQPTADKGGGRRLRNRKLLLDVSDKRIKTFDSGVDIERGIGLLAKQPKSEAALEFCKKLKNSEFLLPIDRITKRPPEMGGHVGTEAESAGIRFLPVFAGAEALRAAPVQIKAAEIVPYETLKHMILENPESFSALIINPFTDPLCLGIEQMDWIDGAAGDVMVRQVTSDNAIEKADPSEYLKGLVKAVIKAMDRFPKVRRVYLVRARSSRTPKPFKPFWMFAVDMHGDEGRFQPEFKKVVLPFMPRGQDEVFQISKADGKNLEMLQRMGIDPIYDRWGKDGKQF